MPRNEKERKINVGITGQAGFIGQHLYNFLNLKKKSINLIVFQRDFFENSVDLDQFVSKCDVVVHLAGVNRHASSQEIYNVNIELTHKIIDSCNRLDYYPHIIFSSSTQESGESIYGNSKKDSRQLFESWSKKKNVKFTGMIIPNVFGPFGKPGYNSVISTFCYQLMHGKKPEIQIDTNLKLIFINQLLQEFYDIIMDQEAIVKCIDVPHQYERKVSEILNVLIKFEADYSKGNVPIIKDDFELCLFNTFRCYAPIDMFPVYLNENVDERGAFVEVLRSGIAGQFSYSTTKKNVTRGNHFHTRKIERFIVIKGKAEIQIRKIGSNKKVSYILDGETPSFIDMPIWHTHNIKNIGQEELLTLFWINEPYNQEDPDTYFEEV